MNISKIYLDMDGVIADFNKRYKELYHMDPRESEKDGKFYSLFEEFINNNNFASLDPMPDAFELIDFLKSLDITIEILSSTARESTFYTIATQKRIWLDKHNITFFTNFVPGKKHKYKFATPNSLIIDDTKSVIDDFINAGGLAIHHSTAVDTIEQLKQILNKTEYL